MEMFLIEEDMVLLVFFKQFFDCSPTSMCYTREGGSVDCPEDRQDST